MPVIWKLDNTASIGGSTVTVLGAPAVQDADKGKTVCFDGAHDGLVVPVNPIAGWSQFTIQARFKPDPEGASEQRFLHVQDQSGKSRALMEIRLNKTGEWWLDTFLASSAGKLALIDPNQRHCTGEWHWVALTYDGKKMMHFINGVREKEGAVEFAPMPSGETSIGVRLNRVYWFKGCIAEIRFDPAVLPAEALQK